MKRNKRNVRLPPLGICGKNAEINLSVVPFQQDCCRLKRIQGYFCSIILKEPWKWILWKEPASCWLVQPCLQTCVPPRTQNAHLKEWNAPHKEWTSVWNSIRLPLCRFQNSRRQTLQQRKSGSGHKLNAKLMIVAWPGFGTHTEQRKELDAKGMIINFNTWPPKSGTRPYDVYNPEARDIYWE